MANPLRNKCARWFPNLVLGFALPLLIYPSVASAGLPLTKDPALPPGVIYLKGKIIDKTAHEFAQLAKTGKVHQLRVTSGGGSEAGALEIGAALQKYHIPVVVDEVCASACANGIFLLAPKRTIMPDSVVMFHNTASSLAAMLSPSEKKQIVQQYLQVAREYETLYAARKIPAVFLFQPQLEIRTSCHELVTAPPGPSNGKEVRYQALFLAWIPTKAYLKREGIEFSGFWPSTKADFITALRRLYAPGTHDLIAIGGAYDGASASEMKAALGRIPKCKLAGSAPIPNPVAKH